MRYIALLLTVFGTNAFAGPLVLIPQHVIKHKVTRTRTYIYQAAGNNVVSRSQVNVINFKTPFVALNEPSGQGIAGTANGEAINANRSFMFTAAGKRHIQFVFSMQNGHSPIILQFDVRDVGAREVNIPTALSGVAPLKTVFKKHRGFEDKILMLTRDALNHKLGAAWVQDAKNDTCLKAHSKMGMTGRFADVKARYFCALTHQVFEPRHIDTYHNNDFNLLTFSVCSDAHNTLNLKDSWFHLSREDVAITITRHALHQNQCAKVVLLRAVAHTQAEKLGALMSPMGLGGH